MSSPRHYYNEIEPYAVQWLRNLMDAGLIPAGDIDTRSIEDVRPSDLAGYVQCHFFAGIGGWPLALQLAGWGNRPVWTGSCPCQPFLQAGKGNGFEDERHLWPAWHHLIAQCEPPVIFGEQVEGPAARAWLDLVHSDLEAIGYAFGAFVLPAASIGAPQLRHRTWFVADADNAGWKGRVRERQPDQAWSQRPATCSESLRPARGPWPPGPRLVHTIPQLANGLSGGMGGCKAYGNAIVPQVAAEVIQAYAEARGLMPVNEDEAMRA